MDFYWLLTDFKECHSTKPVIIQGLTLQWRTQSGRDLCHSCFLHILSDGLPDLFLQIHITVVHLRLPSPGKPFLLCLNTVPLSVSQKACLESSSPFLFVDVGFVWFSLLSLCCFIYHRYIYIYTHYTPISYPSSLNFPIPVHAIDRQPARGMTIYLSTSKPYGICFPAFHINFYSLIGCHPIRWPPLFWIGTAHKGSPSQCVRPSGVVPGLSAYSSSPLLDYALSEGRRCIFYLCKPHAWHSENTWYMFAE